MFQVGVSVIHPKTPSDLSYQSLALVAKLCLTGLQYLRVIGGYRRQSSPESHFCFQNHISIHPMHLHHATLGRQEKSNRRCMNMLFVVAFKPYNLPTNRFVVSELSVWQCQADVEFSAAKQYCSEARVYLKKQLYAIHPF